MRLRRVIILAVVSMLCITGCSKSDSKRNQQTDSNNDASNQVSRQNNSEENNIEKASDTEAGSESTEEASLNNKSSGYYPTSVYISDGDTNNNIDYTYELSNNTITANNNAYNGLLTIPTDINSYIMGHSSMYTNYNLLTECLKDRNELTIIRGDEFDEYTLNDSNVIHRTTTIIRNGKEFKNEDEFSFDDNGNLTYACSLGTADFPVGTDYGYDENGRLIYAIRSNEEPMSVMEGCAYGEYYEYMNTSTKEQLVKVHLVHINDYNEEYEPDTKTYTCRLHLGNEYKEYALAEYNESSVMEFSFTLDEDKLTRAVYRSEGVYTDDFDASIQYEEKTTTQTDIVYDGQQNPVKLDEEKQWSINYFEGGGDGQWTTTQKEINMEWAAKDELE